MGSHGASRAGGGGGTQLPKLTGSEKQIEWANSIRQNYVDAINNFLDSDRRYLYQSRDNPDSGRVSREELYDQLLMGQSGVASDTLYDKEYKNLRNMTESTFKTFKANNPEYPESSLREFQKNNSNQDVAHDIVLKNTGAGKLFERVKTERKTAVKSAKEGLTDQKERKDAERAARIRVEKKNYNQLIKKQLQANLNSDGARKASEWIDWYKRK